MQQTQKQRQGLPKETPLRAQDPHTQMLLLLLLLLQLLQQQLLSLCPYDEA